MSVSEPVVRISALGALGLLVLAMFVDTLFAASPLVLGTLYDDMAQQFLPWREFGFGELAKGNLALWNPHIYAGAPFFGGMQAALLYPPNWLFLVLPLPLAANWSIAVNVWLLGAFMYLWALRRGLAPFAAFVAAALLMFCAPHFLHVHAGHATNLAAMPWIPLLLLAIDEWLTSRALIWCLVGMLAVTLQILAGHPQYVYFTAIIAGAYSLLRLADARTGRLWMTAGLLSIPAGAALLSAVQLLPALEANTETIRGQPLPFAFAASFSFPPENLITLVAPGFFGDISTHPYWGRWYLWEANAFIGVGGLALAAYGMAGRAAGKRALLLTAVFATVLALGDNTPFFRVLFDWMPLFDRFRGAGKFIFMTAVVLAIFAGHGVDRILRERAVPMHAILTACVITGALCVAAMALRRADVRAVVAAMLANGQNYVDARLQGNAGFAMASQAFAVLGLLVAAITLAITAGLAFWARQERRAVYLLGVFVIAEVFLFARMHRPAFDSKQIVIAQLRDFVASHPGDYRILNLAFPNSAISMRAFDAWGYDPSVIRRYAEFMEWSAGGDPNTATQYVIFRRFHPLLSMVRVQYVVAVDDNVMKIVPGATPPLRRLELVGSYQVQKDRDGILRALGDASFDAHKQVILERVPDPEPLASDNPGHATITREGTDFIDIEADLATPSLLLVTDSWAPEWRAKALPGSSQSSYELLPANYILRAIALHPGKHRLRLEYASLAFPLGAAVSVLAWTAWIVAICLLMQREKGSVRA